MSETPGVTGHLELVCDVDSRGLTRVRHQSFRAPVHLSKPYREDSVLVLNVVNPTAGFLEGDRLRTEVRVEPGARLLLTTPSASRIHTMRGGRAETEQHFHVDGGSLEVWPELLIPQRGARYHQCTRATVAGDGELILFETLAPGRVASGEAFAYDELKWATDVYHDGQLIARERYRLAAGEGALDFLRRRFPHAYYASAFIIAPMLKAPFAGWSALRARGGGDHVWLGISQLAEGAFALKMLAADSVSFRRTLHAARRLIHEALRRSPPDLRRAGEPGTW